MSSEAEVGMKQSDDPKLRELTLRFAADMLCLWHLCDQAACRRAQACRGDVRVCAARVADWYGAVMQKKREGPSFEAMEETLEGTSLAVFRRWKAGVLACSK
jgi:hypothetical protein